MDNDDFALNVFETELGNSRDIDNRAKYLASGAAIFIGIIINFTLNNQFSFAVVLPVTVPIFLFFISFYHSITALVSYNFGFMPNSTSHCLFSKESDIHIKDLNSTHIIDILYGQAKIFHIQNINKSRMLYKGYTFFVGGIIAVIMSSAYLLSLDIPNTYALIYAFAEIVHFYISYKQYKKYPI